MEQRNRTINVVIGGEAGQGLATVGELLAKSLVRSGYHILVTQDYMSRIRGGHNTFRIRTGRDPIDAPGTTIDILAALNDETVALHQAEISADTLVVTDATTDAGALSCLKVPYKDLASVKMKNVVALGILSSLLDLNKALIEQTVSNFFGVKKPGVADENKQALGKSFNWLKDQSLEFKSLPRAEVIRPMITVSGNEALGLGALAAGVQFCAFYPMSPSTSIPLTLIRHADKLGVIVEQAEDEIAAINMAIGASFAGARSMTATSGGGFALMTEGVSLAGMTETPLVIVVAQRPGPATGLPTRTEQGDLDFVLHGGHGEFPRAIYAPGSVDQCFSLTLQAFDTAERYQSPVFILTDQLLADTLCGVEPFTLSGSGNAIGRPEVAGPYWRYRITDSGVSPLLAPGVSEHLVIADSDEHTEEGHITEDLTVRTQMVRKRIKKENGIIEEVIAPEYHGDNEPELILLSWGSSRGSVEEAADNFRSTGTSVGTLHFSQVWPLRADQFLAHLEGAGKVVMVESNATGQFAGLLRRETGFHTNHHVRRYDGLPLTPAYIRDNLK